MVTTPLRLLPEARNTVGIKNCTKSDTSEMVENTKAITERLLRNSTKFHRTFARR